MPSLKPLAETRKLAPRNATPFTAAPFTAAALTVAAVIGGAAGCSTGDYILASRRAPANTGGDASGSGQVGSGPGSAGQGGARPDGGAPSTGSTNGGGAGGGSNDLARGLVLHLPFDGGLEDLAGARAGTYVSENDEMASFAAGVSSEGLDLRETQGHVTFTYEQALTPEDFTLSFWARSALPDQQFQEVFVGVGRDCLSSFFCGVYPDATLKCAINDGRGWCEDAVVLDAPWPVDQFVHVAFVVEQSPSPPHLQALLYIDGDLAAAEEHADYYRVADPGRPFVIGAHYMETDGGGIAPYFANAELDELRLYNRPLSAHEIRLLFEQRGL